VSIDSLRCASNDFYNDLSARVVELTGKPDFSFDYINNYLLKVYPYRYLEDACGFTPAEMRSLRAMRSFLTYVENHGCKAPAAFVWCDLNTGKNICLVNASITTVAWELVPYAFEEIVR
jgi:hypothetical protein